MSDQILEWVKVLGPILSALLGFITVYRTGTIHKLVNSAMTAIKADLAIRDDKIRDLQALVTALSPKETTISPTLMAPPGPPPTVAKPV